MASLTRRERNPKTSGQGGRTGESGRGRGRLTGSVPTLSVVPTLLYSDHIQHNSRRFNMLCGPMVQVPERGCDQATISGEMASGGTQLSVRFPREMVENAVMDHVVHYYYVPGVPYVQRKANPYAPSKRTQPPRNAEEEGYSVVQDETSQSTPSPTTSSTSFKKTVPQPVDTTSSPPKNPKPTRSGTGSWVNEIFVRFRTSDNATTWYPIGSVESVGPTHFESVEQLRSQKKTVSEFGAFIEQPASDSPMKQTAWVREVEYFGGWVYTPSNTAPTEYKKTSKKYGGTEDFSRRGGSGTVYPATGLTIKWAGNSPDVAADLTVQTDDRFERVEAEVLVPGLSSGASPSAENNGRTKKPGRTRKLTGIRVTRGPGQLDPQLVLATRLARGERQSIEFDFDAVADKPSLDFDAFNAEWDFVHLRDELSCRGPDICTRDMAAVDITDKRSWLWEAWGARRPLRQAEREAAIKTGFRCPLREAEREVVVVAGGLEDCVAAACRGLLQLSDQEVVARKNGLSSAPATTASTSSGETLAAATTPVTRGSANCTPSRYWSCRNTTTRYWSFHSESKKCYVFRWCDSGKMDSRVAGWASGRVEQGISCGVDVQSLNKSEAGAPDPPGEGAPGPPGPGEGRKRDDEEEIQFV